MNNKQKGYKNEELVKKFLQKQWYEILYQNFTIRGGEIDIIAQKDGIIHFVEVKSSYSVNDFQDYISVSKIKALEKTAQTWLVRNQIDLPYEFDLALVKDENIDYIENFLF